MGTLCGGDALWWGRFVVGTLCSGDALWGDAMWRGHFVEGRFVEAPNISTLIESMNLLFRIILSPITNKNAPSFTTL